MDCFNVIAAAAGGWDKVKLVGSYTEQTVSIPAWKLGIYSPSTPATVNTPNPSITWCSGVLVAPGSMIDFRSDSGSYKIQFTTSSILTAFPTLRGTAILFTW